VELRSFTHTRLQKTGAGTPHGIGRSAVLKYAMAGASIIYACDLQEQHFSSLIEQVKLISSDCKIVGCKLDVTLAEGVEALVREIVGKEGRLDWFVSRHGFLRLPQHEY